MIVESFLIITMATFNFTVMSGCSRANLLMFYSDFSTDNIKRMDSVCFLQVGEFASVICLQNLWLIAKVIDRTL